MQNPFDGFQQGLMTGAQLGGRMRQNQQRREIGGLAKAGDWAGAAQAAYGAGDVGLGAQLGQFGRAEESRTRGRQISGALAQGDFQGAMSFAQSPEELQAITEFRDNASQADRARAAQRAGDLASLITSIQGLPADQQLAAAQQAAPQFNIDPALITPQSLTPQALEGLKVQALGLKDYLTYDQREREAQRPIIGNGFVSLPPGTPVPSGMGGGQSLGATLPPGWTVNRPNQPPSAPAAGGGERSQPVSVRFSSSNEAQAAIQQIVPGVRVTSGRRSVAENRRVGGSPGSFHLQDRARDLVPPPGMSMAQLASRMRQSGFRALDEGDHVHVSW